MPRILKIALIGGLVAGVLDILYAFIVYGPLTYGMTPLAVLQSVAAGWTGREAAMAGGWATGAIGLASHFAIAIIMAAAYASAAGRFRALTARPVLWGFVYGLLLYVVMNYVVVQLSAAGADGHFVADAADAAARLRRAFGALRPAAPMLLLGTLFTHTVLVGIPIALVARRFARSGRD